MKSLDVMTWEDREAALKTYPELREQTQGMSHAEALAFLRKAGYVAYMVVNGEGRLGRKRDA